MDFFDAEDMFLRWWRPSPGRAPEESSRHLQFLFYLKQEMPKSNRSGQALTLTAEQLDAVMLEVNPICRAALSTCRFTAARITEALSLRWENITPTDIVIPKAVTKKKMRTRTIPMNPKLWDELARWREVWIASHKREPNRIDFVLPGGAGCDDKSDAPQRGLRAARGVQETGHRGLQHALFPEKRADRCIGQRAAAGHPIDLGALLARHAAAVSRRQG